MARRASRTTVSRVHPPPAQPWYSPVSVMSAASPTRAELGGSRRTTVTSAKRSPRAESPAASASRSARTPSPSGDATMLTHIRGRSPNSKLIDAARRAVVGSPPAVFFRGGANEEGEEQGKAEGESESDSQGSGYSDRVPGGDALSQRAWCRAGDRFLQGRVRREGGDAHARTRRQARARRAADRRRAGHARRRARRDGLPRSA